MRRQWEATWYNFCDCSSFTDLERSITFVYFDFNFFLLCFISFLLCFLVLLWSMTTIFVIFLFNLFIITFLMNWRLALFLNVFRQINSGVHTNLEAYLFKSHTKCTFLHLFFFLFNLFLFKSLSFSHFFADCIHLSLIMLARTHPLTQFLALSDLFGALLLICVIFIYLFN